MVGVAVDALNRGGHLRVAQGEDAAAVGGPELGQGDAQRLGQQRIGQAADELLRARGRSTASATPTATLRRSGG
jgi:hypothetical protein